MARKKYTMLDVLEDWAKIQPNEKCLLQDDKIITYQERFWLFRDSMILKFFMGPSG